MKSQPEADSLPLLLPAAICAASVAVYVWLRIFLYGEQYVPLAYALPLLLTLWHRNRGLHYAMIGAFTFIGAYQVFGLTPPATKAVPDPIAFSMILTNILTVGVVCDQLLLFRRRTIAHVAELEQANAELEAANEELAAREEEISSQNEELQRQSEELEQQTEELQQQTEELHHQGEELAQLHEESTTRERILEALLRVGAGLESRDCGAVEDQICEASLAAFNDVAGSLVLMRNGTGAAIAGSRGIAIETERRSHAFDDPFLDLVMTERRPAAIEDLGQTPEVRAPASDDDIPFRSVLAAPIRIHGQVAGAIAVYCQACKSWTETDFKAIRWLAAQSAPVLLGARLREELDQRTTQAEEASVRKTRFLAAVSHDVRTPANVISLMAEVIKRTGENPELIHQIPEMAESLRSNAKLLVELVSDVLDLSRFDSGKIDLEESEFSLHEILQAEAAQYQALAESGGLVLAAITPPEPIWVRTDRMKLARVLGNLIGNAIKFTEVGSVELRALAAADGSVEIRVSDTGVGMDDEHLEHIFDEFFQIKNPERDRSKGTGLGLAICKRLIDAIGCTISVKSQVDKGTTFTIRIPPELIVDARDDEEQPPAAETETDGLSGLRMLVVEDHETTRLAVTALLSARGATVDQAEDGRSALRMLRHSTPDVVLLDLMLPDMDGREVLRRLKDRRPGHLRCLLAVSGDVTDARQREVRHLGADGLVPKPVRIDELCACIRDHLAAPKDGCRGSSM